MKIKDFILLFRDRIKERINTSVKDIIEDVKLLNSSSTLLLSTYPINSNCFDMLEIKVNEFYEKNPKNVITELKIIIKEIDRLIREIIPDEFSNLDEHTYLSNSFLKPIQRILVSSESLLYPFDELFFTDEAVKFFES